MNTISLLNKCRRSGSGSIRAGSWARPDGHKGGRNRMSVKHQNPYLILFQICMFVFVHVRNEILRLK